MKRFFTILFLLLLLPSTLAFSLPGFVVDLFSSAPTATVDDPLTFEEIVATIPGSGEIPEKEEEAAPAEEATTAADLQIYELNGVPVVDDLFNEQLYTFHGIPNIYCNETKTSYKKFCGGSEELVRQLKNLSATILVPKNYTLMINQGYRDYETQNYFWKKYGAGKACNPNPKGKQCPHMVSGAIDITIKTAAGASLTTTQLERLMCDFGFVRYSAEKWHYEYGTSKWEYAQQMRAKGVDYCRY